MKVRCAPVEQCELEAMPPPFGDRRRVEQKVQAHVFNAALQSFESSFSFHYRPASGALVEVRRHRSRNASMSASRYLTIADVSFKYAGPLPR